MKCGSCGEVFSDGPQCGSCKKHFDFSCAGISEGGYRKLGPERRSAWRCPQCKATASSPNPTAISPTPANMDSIMRELREIKEQLAGLPGLVQDVKRIKVELTELKESVQYTSATLDDHASRLSALENNIGQLSDLNDKLTDSQREVDKLRSELATKEQWVRLNNIEIKGVPLKKEENLFSIVDSLGKVTGYNVPKCQINYISRVPVFNSKEKVIIVSFLNRYVKEEFVAAARAKRSITQEDIGYPENKQRIYINDHLTPESKMLLTRTKVKAKEKNYLYAWVKYGKIHVRKNDTSPVLIIARDGDLNKIS